MFWNKTIKRIDEEKESLEREVDRLKSEVKEKELLQSENEQLKEKCNELESDMERIYAGHKGLEEEISFLKYRIRTLDELHESIVFGKWPHDGSLKKYTCRYPFERVEILPRGEVYTCCSAYLKHNYYIGNIFENSFEDIWNSERARKLRWSVEQGNFEFCQKYCKFLYTVDANANTLQDNPIQPRNEYTCLKEWKDYVVEESPKYISLSCDETCNLHCPSCRSNVKALNREESERLYSKLMEVVRPMLANCQLLGALGSGELFASSAVSRFYKTLSAKEFPKLRLYIMTNLQLVDENKWEEFSNLLEIPKRIGVSIDGASKETYEINRAGGNWERLQKNLRNLLKLKKRPEAHIDYICLNFIVQKNNYHEIEKFVEMAQNMGGD